MDKRQEFANFLQNAIDDLPDQQKQFLEGLMTGILNNMQDSDIDEWRKKVNDLMSAMGEKNVFD